jgi:hypothetical protein
MSSLKFTCSTSGIGTTKGFRRRSQQNINPPKTKNPPRIPPTMPPITGPVNCGDDVELDMGTDDAPFVACDALFAACDALFVACAVLVPGVGGVVGENLLLVLLI